MHVTRIPVALFVGALVACTLSAQAPADGIDAHINAARTAAGLDYRATFVNLCFTGANPGLANPAVARAGGSSAGGRARGCRRARGRRHTRSGDVVRLALQGIRQPVLARHPAAFVVGAAHERRAHHHRHEFRVGNRARESSTGLTTLGLDPRKSSYVVISHAHGDHDQGAAELQKRLWRKVVMGAPDWDATFGSGRHSGRGRADARRGLRSRRNEAHARDTTVDIVATPGHTPGTLSYVFPGEGIRGRDGHGRVFRRHADRRFGTNAAAWDEYIESQKRIARRPPSGCDGHPFESQRVRQRVHEGSPRSVRSAEAGEGHPSSSAPTACSVLHRSMTECATAS
jgi:hypothetical protein